MTAISARRLRSPSRNDQKAADRRKARGLIARLSLIGFITALASRATDPIIPPIAHDIQVDPNAVALLTTAFALPFALVQPVLGPVGDMVGKVRVMIACLAVTIARDAGERARDRLHGAAGRAHRRRRGGRRHLPGRHRGDRRSRAGEGAPGRDRPLAHRGHHRQPARLVARRRGRRSCSAGAACSSSSPALGAVALVVAVVSLREAARAKPVQLRASSGFSARLRHRCSPIRARKSASARCSSKAS